MASSYYKPCKELDECEYLIEVYYKTRRYKECFDGHMKLAQKGYPLAECQIGYFYLEGLGVEKDLSKALYWSEQSAIHGDRDGQYNLAWFYEKGIGTVINLEQATYWYQQAALQHHNLALQKCKEMAIYNGN